MPVEIALVTSIRRRILKCYSDISELDSLRRRKASAALERAKRLVVLGRKNEALGILLEVVSQAHRNGLGWMFSDASGKAPLHVRAWEMMMTYLLAVTDTPGELGTIANLEQSTRCGLKLVEGYDQELVAWLGKALSDTANISSRYQGEPRIIVPTQRTVVAKGETPTLKVLVLDNEPPTEARLCWRMLGQGEFKKIPLRHVARGVYEVTLPVVPEEGAEYFVRAKTVAGQELVWPATAPTMNHTLVQMP